MHNGVFAEEASFPLHNGDLERRPFQMDYSTNENPLGIGLNQVGVVCNESVVGIDAPRNRNSMTLQIQTDHADGQNIQEDQDHLGGQDIAEKMKQFSRERAEVLPEQHSVCS